MQTIDTQAGDDSDGKIWGLEGSNILIAVGGCALGVSVTVLSFLIGATPPVTALCYGIMPAVLGLVYVFTLREGKPKSFDRDLLETFLAGRSWQSQPLSKPHPLFLLLIIFYLFPFGFLQAQFIPGQYTDVQQNVDYEYTLMSDEPYGIQVGTNVLWTGNNTLHTVRLYLDDQEVLKWQILSGDSGSGLQIAGFGKMIKGPLKAGTKLRLKGVMDAPGNPSARIVILSIGAMSYDSAIHLTNLEQKVNGLEAVIANLQSQVNQNAISINEITDQIANLRGELSDLRKRFDALDLDYSQFKVELNSRLDGIDKRISDVENNLRRDLNALTLSFDDFKRDTNSHFNSTDKRIDQLKASTDFQFGNLNRDLNGVLQPLDALNIDHNQFKTNINSRLDSVNKKINHSLNRLARRTRFNNTLGIIGTSVGGAAAVLGGGAFYQFMNEHAALHEREQSMEEMP